MIDRRDDFLPVSKPFIAEGTGQQIAAVVDRCQISGNSNPVAEFEAAFGRALDRPCAAAVSSGTAALHLALLSIGVSPGDEVVIPDFAMAAPIFAILYCGATPVLVDVDESWNLDPTLIEGRLTARTKAILVVHTYGHPADMRAIADIAGAAGVPLVEDGAEALGARAWGQQVGTFGTVACFSFYANKAITTGEGGMVVTSSPAIIDAVKSMRSMCFGDSDSTRFIHDRIGFNYRMSGMQAALGISQLDRLEDSVRQSRANSSLYRQGLADIPGITLPPEMPWARSSYWVFGILVDSSFGRSRNDVRDALARSGIETRPFFEPGHRQPYLPRQVSEDVDFPRSSQIADQGLYLPNYDGLRPSDISRVCTAFRAAS